MLSVMTSLLAAPIYHQPNSTHHVVVVAGEKKPCTITRPCHNQFFEYVMTFSSIYHIASDCRKNKFWPVVRYQIFYTTMSFH
jgi:hypothetical protein